MNKWVLLRLCLIFIVVIASFFAPLEPQAVPSIDYFALLVIFLFCPLGMLFVIGIQAINPESQKAWKKPAWNLNPLNVYDPVQFFHFGAYVVLVQGFVTILRIYAEKVPFYIEAYVPLVMGAGILFGIKLVMLVFRSKFREST